MRRLLAVGVTLEGAVLTYLGGLTSRLELALGLGIALFGLGLIAWGLVIWRRAVWR